ADLSGQVEGNREPGSALRNQIAIAAVTFLRAAEAAVLAHGPEPAAVHVRIDAPRVRELTGLLEVHEREILRARRKEEIPKLSMMKTNRTLMTTHARLPLPLSSS